MIENEALQNILENATDISVVCEIYDADAVPTADGFDPEDALDCFAAVGGITFRTRDYKRLVTKFGNIKRTMTAEINSASVTFSNVTREISEFEFTNGFEGLILVIRLLSRSLSTALTDTQILFTGRCEKPSSGDKESLTVQARFILGSLNVMIPRRKFSQDDPEGRVASDPEFEGFLFMPQEGTVSFPRKAKRGGILGLLGLKKQVIKTMHWSSFSDVDASKSVPEVFGRAQIMGVHMSHVDIGTKLRVREAFCEGEIEDIINARSTDLKFPLSATAYFEFYGLVGAANGPDDPGWAGGTGFHSRTAGFRGECDNSLVDEFDETPDIVAVIIGRKMTIPDGSGDWVDYGWTNNGAAQARFVITSSDYYKLDENWIDDDSFLETYNYNAELIFNKSLSDFLFVEPA